MNEYEKIRGMNYCIAKIYKTDYFGLLKEIEVFGIYGENARDFCLS